DRVEGQGREIPDGQMQRLHLAIPESLRVRHGDIESSAPRTRESSSLAKQSEQREDWNSEHDREPDPLLSSQSKPGLDRRRLRQLRFVWQLSGEPRVERGRAEPDDSACQPTADDVVEPVLIEIESRPADAECERGDCRPEQNLLRAR